MNTDWNDLIQRHIAGHSTDEEARHLAAALKTDDALADLYVRHVELELSLEARAASTDATRELLTTPTLTRATRWLSWRPLTAAAAGLMIGLFSASIVWSMSVTRNEGIMQSVKLVADPFETGFATLEQGLPLVPGVWGGDTAELTGHSLRFLRPGSALEDRTSSAIACDLYQIVDLRSLRDRVGTKGDAILELTASFRDARAVGSEKMAFACHIYLLEGSIESIHDRWPPKAGDTLGVGANYLFSQGGDGEAAPWRSVTARCVSTPLADYAVIKISVAHLKPAGRNTPALEGLFADDVSLVLKALPLSGK